MSEDLTRIRNRLVEIDQLTQALSKEREELLIAERVVARLGARSVATPTNISTNEPVAPNEAAATFNGVGPFGGVGALSTTAEIITSVARSLSQKALIIST